MDLAKLMEILLAAKDPIEALNSLIELLQTLLHCLIKWSGLLFTIMLGSALKKSFV